jgi:ABC-2 type transport system ATP-binding protein
VGGFKDLLSRQYREIEAVRDVEFSVSEGELIGFIGANGAGKSTTIKMLTGILRPTRGEMNVLGYHPFSDRKNYTKNIGVVFGQRTQLWWDIAVQESFELLGRIYEVPRDEFNTTQSKLINILEIGSLLATPVRKLSLGQRMRCDLAASLLHSPKVLFLDEPTIGLDAVAKDTARKFLREINAEFRTTIMLTTHDLKEIEELCKRVIILDCGQIVYDGLLENIRTLPGLTRRLVVHFAGKTDASAVLQAVGKNVELENVSIRSVVGSFDPSITPTVNIVREIFAHFDVADLTIEEPGIEEIVMKIYKDGVSTGNSQPGSSQ